MKSKLWEVWGLRILSLTIAIIIALVFYVRFYQSFLGDWYAAAWAALAVSVGSVVVTAYAIASFRLNFSSWGNRLICASLWLFATGLFLFDRATETYTMQNRKMQTVQKTIDLKMSAIDKLPILHERLIAVQDANRKLSDITRLDSLTAAAGHNWRYVTLRREAQRERRHADSLYHVERSQQIALVLEQSREIKDAGIVDNGLGLIVKNWPSAALGLVILGLLIAAHWRETEYKESEENHKPHGVNDTASSLIHIGRGIATLATEEHNNAATRPERRDQDRVHPFPAGDELAAADWLSLRVLQGTYDASPGMAGDFAYALKRSGAKETGRRSWLYKQIMKTKEWKNDKTQSEIDDRIAELKFRLARNETLRNMETPVFTVSTNGSSNFNHGFDSYQG